MYEIRAKTQKILCAEQDDQNLRNLHMFEGKFSLDVAQIQSNFNGSNIIGTMEICSRYE